MGTPSYMAPEQAAGKIKGARAGLRRLWPGSCPVRADHRPAAVPLGHAAGHGYAGCGRRAGAAPVAQSQNRSRPGNDLPEVPGKRAAEALCQRRRTGGRSAALSGRPNDQGAQLQPGVAAHACPQQAKSRRGRPAHGGRLALGVQRNFSAGPPGDVCTAPDRPTGLGGVAIACQRGGVGRYSLLVLSPSQPAAGQRR